MIYKKYAIKITNALNIFTCNFLVNNYLFTTFKKLSSLAVIISLFLVSLAVVKKNQSKLESLDRQLAQGLDYLTSEIRKRSFLEKVNACLDRKK